MAKKIFVLFLAIFIVGLGTYLITLDAQLLASDRSIQQAHIEAGQLPGRFAGKGIIVGLEYVVGNNKRLVESMAGAFAETGMPGIKHIAGDFKWGVMQKKPKDKINFKTMDLYITEYQKRGFTELTLCLQSHCGWGSKDISLFGGKNSTPKPQYASLFEDWISAIVERYDGDGIDDMPELRWPVRHVEIGSEFSSYSPEPVDDYIEMLRMAYEAAHRASNKVKIGHSAFLITPVNLDVEDPSEYEKVWNETKRRDTFHDLKDQRIVLDHPEFFDFINIHNLGYPYEIEHIMRWLQYETGLRKYKKPVVISDTTPTSYAGWGAATTCKGNNLALLGAPATEADRCRLAAYFTKMVNDNPITVNWTRGFIAADHVQRTVIAAEQGIKLINLSFTTDIPTAKIKAFKAAAGISAWAGALDINIFTGKVNKKFPLFYAIKQMMSRMNGYTSIKRIPQKDDRARVYQVVRKGKTFWIAWRDPKSVLLPEDGKPSIRVQLRTGTRTVSVEEVITRMNQKEPQIRRLKTPGDLANLTLTHTPVYIIPE